MKRTIFILIVILTFVSCRKDKIGLMDKRNDCKNCLLTKINEDGKILETFSGEQIVGFKDLYDNFCDLLIDLNGKEIETLEYTDLGELSLSGVTKYGIRCN
jgi:hypothetical protein